MVILVVFMDILEVRGILNLFYNFRDQWSHKVPNFFTYMYYTGFVKSFFIAGGCPLVCAGTVDKGECIRYEEGFSRISWKKWFFSWISEIINLICHKESCHSKGPKKIEIKKSKSNFWKNLNQVADDSWSVFSFTNGTGWVNNCN